MALIPESRRLQGLCLSLSVGFNLNLPVYERISPFGVVRRADELRNAEAQIRDLRIRTPGAARQVGKLSGGNQQKVVLGKWLLHGAELYIFDEPTTGVDVATKLEIYKLMAALLKGGRGSSWSPRTSRRC